MLKRKLHDAPAEDGGMAGEVLPGMVSIPCGPGELETAPAISQGLAANLAPHYWRSRSQRGRKLTGTKKRGRGRRHKPEESRG